MSPRGCVFHDDFHIACLQSAFPGFPKVAMRARYFRRTTEVVSLASEHVALCEKPSQWSLGRLIISIADQWVPASQEQPITPTNCATHIAWVRGQCRVWRLVEQQLGVWIVDRGLAIMG